LNPDSTAVDADWTQDWTVMDLNWADAGLVTSLVITESAINAIKSKNVNCAAISTELSATTATSLL